MNNQRTRNKSLGDETTRLGEFWSMLEQFRSVLELEFEESGCQA
jgi:hypothetical protein